MSYTYLYSHRILYIAYHSICIFKGEYNTLVVPQDMDEETLKLIQQKRPKLQCKALPSSSSNQLDIVGMSPYLLYLTTLKQTAIFSMVKYLMLHRWIFGW